MRLRDGEAATFLEQLIASRQASGIAAAARAIFAAAPAMNGNAPAVQADMSPVGASSVPAEVSSATHTHPVGQPSMPRSTTGSDDAEQAIVHAERVGAEDLPRGSDQTGMTHQALEDRVAQV